jgi:hypothetical protein
VLRHHDVRDWPRGPHLLSAQRQQSAFRTRPLRPDISPVAVNCASVLGWRRSPLLAVGRCSCCHRCCQLTLSGGQRVTKVPRRHGGFWATLNYAPALHYEEIFNYKLTRRPR